MAKPKITRIKAGESSKKEEEQAPITRKKVVVKDKKQDKIKAKEARKAERQAKKAEKPLRIKKYLFYFGRLWRYLDICATRGTKFAKYGGQIARQPGKWC